MTNNKYASLEKAIGYEFKNKQHLDIAFTHKSYANEHTNLKIVSYERYEFLGDAILEFLSSATLFELYKDKNEGELTKLRASLVCEQTLSQIAKELGFGDYVILSKGEIHTGGRSRSSILCDLFESILGAIYLDGGMDSALKFVKRFLLNNIENRSLFYDAKTTLQEYSQKHEVSLEYNLIRESGPDHNKEFLVEVLIDGVCFGTGEGHNIKGAEQMAAYKALLKVKEI